MCPPAVVLVAMDGLQGLIQHLGENPGDRDASTLAARFGLDEGVVALALERAQGRRASPAPKPREPRAWLRKLDEAWSAAAADPVRAVWALCLVALAMSAAFAFLRSGPLADRRDALSFAFGVGLVGLTAAMGALLFRTGRVREAALGAAGLAVAVTLGLALGALGTMNVVQGAALVLVLGLVDLMIFVPVSSLGAYVAVRKAERADRAMTRQQMLVRLLEIRERLAAAPDAGRSVPAAAGPRHTAMLAALAGIVPLRLAFDALLVRLDPARSSLAGGEAAAGDPRIVLLLIASQIVMTAGTFVVGYLSRSVLLGCLAGFLIEGSGWMLAAFGLSYFPLDQMAGAGWVAIAASLVLPVVAGTTGGMAGRAREHLRLRRLRAENDPRALVTEMVDLEWRLRPGSRHVCVVVVDVAGSTKMKSGADPLVAEMCFRAYQDLVEHVATQHGGEVASRAGDGAVLAFECEQDALDAALALQAAMPEFNRSRNRLAAPFRLRAGLHCGEVMGDLSEVEYSGVIDVAAHVESLAPVGGVAVSNDVVERLPGLPFSTLGQSAGGHEVFVALPAGHQRAESQAVGVE